MTIAGAPIPLAILLFAALLMAALVTDVVWLRIPNWIAVSLIVLFPVAALAAPRSGSWWLSHVAAGAIVLVVGMGLFAWGKIGGGDAKLMAAIGLWSGLALLPSLFLVIGVLNGAVILIYMGIRFYCIGAYFEARGVHIVSLQPGKDMPFAVAAAAGCWLFLQDFLI
jgi:prepilin peptidase CpaA